MIIIFFAVAHESSAFQQALRGKKVARQIRILHTGMGWDAAEKKAREVVATQPPELIISAGYAGGLDPALAHATVFLAKNYTAPQFLARHPLPTARLLTYREAVESAEEKAALFRSTGAQAVDMETAAIAGVAAEFQVPMLALRVISDHALAPLAVPLLVSYDMEKQRPRPLALLTYLARRREKIFPFVHFVWGLNAARSALSDALLTICAREQAHAKRENARPI